MANKFLVKLHEIHQEMKANSKKEILTMDDACQMLGMSKSYLYRLTSERQIPHFKPLNKVVYFKRSELISWIETGRVHTCSNCSILINEHSTTKNL